jgi:hypothetical protein
MNKEILQKANELAKLISEHENALSCFEFDVALDGFAPEWISTNPQLIIEYDDCDAREQQKIPMVLSDFLINIIKGSIRENLSKLQEEFKRL